LAKTKGSQETRMGTSKNEYWHKETTYKHQQKLSNGTTKNQEITFKSKRLTFGISCKFLILTKSCILVAYHGELVSS
jgi:hypothetical protein